MRPGSAPEQRPRNDPEPVWEAIYEELGEKVFRFLYRFTQNRELAADLTHDTFVRVFEKRHTFDRRGSLAGWVYRIAGNLARDHLRRPRLFLPLEPSGSDLPREIEAPRASDPALAVSLRDALDRLPEALRVVLVLYEVDGFTHVEIAELTGSAVGTSKARLFRARAALRRELGQVPE